MSDVPLLFGVCVYLIVHLLSYAVFRPPVLRTERGVFLYHLLPAAGMSLVLLVLSWANDTTSAAAAAMIALHGVYSLSFLELWSLAEGSYSLSILAFVYDPDRRSTLAQGGVSILEQIGEHKQQNRIGALLRLGLVQRQGGCIALTARGRVLARALDGLRQWTQPRQPMPSELSHLSSEADS